MLVPPGKGSAAVDCVYNVFDQMSRVLAVSVPHLAIRVKGSLLIKARY